MSSSLSSPRRAPKVSAATKSVSPRSRAHVGASLPAPTPVVEPVAAVSVVAPKTPQSNTKKLAPLVLTFGSDPELMLVDTKQGGKIVSAIPILKYDKHDPIDLGNGVKTYWDNVNIECSFNPVSTDRGLIVGQFKDAFTRIQNHIGSRYQLLPKACHVFDADQLDTDGARLVGCTPSFNAWSQSVNAPGEFYDGSRTTAAHLHLWRADWKNPSDDRLMSLDSKELATKLCDIYVGCSNTIFSKDPTAKDRRRLYGRSGEHRHTAGGIEYRVLEGYILTNQELTQLAYDLAEYALSHISDGTGNDVLKLIDPIQVQTAINDSDVRLARKVLDQACLPHKLLARVNASYENLGFSKTWGLS